MKKISAVLLGLSLTLATAGLSLAAPTDNSTPATAKKHVKKNKKAAAAKPATAATPAVPATPAK